MHRQWLSRFALVVAKVADMYHTALEEHWQLLNFTGQRVGLANLALLTFTGETANAG